MSRFGFGRNINVSATGAFVRHLFQAKDSFTIHFHLYYKYFYTTIAIQIW